MRKAFRLTAALIFLAEALFCIPATAASSQSPVPAAAQTQLSSLIGQENSQYYARTTRTGILANNPAQDLETVFSSAGASFENDSSRWRVALRGYGYGDAVMAAARVTPVASGNRVEYRRKKSYGMVRQRPRGNRTRLHVLPEAGESSRFAAHPLALFRRQSFGLARAGRRSHCA